MGVIFLGPNVLVFSSRAPCLDSRESSTKEKRKEKKREKRRKGVLIVGVLQDLSFTKEKMPPMGNSTGPFSGIPVLVLLNAHRCCYSFLTYFEDRCHQVSRRDLRNPFVHLTAPGKISLRKILK